MTALTNLSPVDINIAEVTSSHNNVVEYSKRNRESGIAPKILPNKVQKQDNHGEELFNNSDINSNRSIDSGNNHVTEYANEKQNIVTRLRISPIVTMFKNNITLLDLKAIINKSIYEVTSSAIATKFQYK